MNENSNTDNASKLNAQDNQKKRSEIPKTLGFLITFAGVFFLVASLFSLLTLVVLQMSTGDSEPLPAKVIYAAFLTISTILTSLAAMYIGIKLVKQLDIGRKLFNIYTIVVIILAWGKYTYKQNEIAKAFANIPPELAAASKGIELSDALTVYILPIILIVVAVLLNIQRSKNALKN